MFVLKMVSKDMAAEAAINSISVARVEGAELSETLEFVPQWIGRSNTLRVRIEGPGPHPKGHPGFAGGSPEEPANPIADGRVRAEVIRLPDGFHMGEAVGDRFALVEWKFDPDAPPDFPLILENTFAAGPQPAPAWRRSRLPAPSPATRASLLAFFARLNQALSDGDVQWIVTRNALKIADLSRAMNFDVATQQRDFAAFLNEALPVAGLLPITDDQLAVVPQGDGHLLRCTRPDGSELVTTAPGAGEPFSLDVKVGYIDGEWHLF